MDIYLLLPNLRVGANAPSPSTKFPWDFKSEFTVLILSYNDVVLLLEKLSSFILQESIVESFKIITRKNPTKAATKTQTDSPKIFLLCLRHLNFVTKIYYEYFILFYLSSLKYFLP